MPRLPFALLIVLSVASCRSQSISEFGDTVRDADIRCLAAEPDMTIASPFGPRRTDELLTKVRANLVALERLFEVEVPATLAVHFRALEMPGIEMQLSEDGQSYDVSGMEAPSHHGVLGYSTRRRGAPEVTIYVVPTGTLAHPDGREITVSFDFGTELTIRHELAHVCAMLADLNGPTWFDEGVALELEYSEWNEAGELVRRPVPVTLRVAHRRRADATLDEVLAWKEDFGAVYTGDEQPFLLGRPLAHALMRFLLQRDERAFPASGESLRARLLRIRALEDDELRALEPEWLAWLTDLPLE